MSGTDMPGTPEVNSLGASSVAQFHSRDQPFAKSVQSKEANALNNLRWKAQTEEEMITAGLKRLYGKDATVRSESQLQAIKFVMQNHEVSAIIMPTGAGKSTVFTVPATFREAKLTLVVVPFTALLEDMVRRCQKLGLRTCKWVGTSNSEKTLGTAEIVVAGTWNCKSDMFRTWVKKVSLMGLLDRIVIDEAHLLYSQAKFRPEMREVYGLRDFGCPLVLLTATLPPRETKKLESILRIEKGSTPIRYLRQRTTRRNIEYSIRTLANTDDCLPQLLADIELDSPTLQDSGARAIVYSRSHRDAERVGRILKCGVYHGGLKEGAKTAEFTKWANGGPAISKFISATSGLGVGIDIPGVRIVYHFRESQDFLGFVQESGRAGRDGLPAKSKVYLDTTSLERLNKLRLARDLTPAEKAISEYHNPGFCRRSSMSFYVDGESEWCAKNPELIPCDLCLILMSQARGAGHPPLSNGPNGNSSPAMLFDMNNQTLLQRPETESTSALTGQMVDLHGGRHATHVYHALDGPLNCLPGNSTEFRIPPRAGTYKDHHMEVLPAGSGTLLHPQVPQSDRITFQNIEDEYLTQVYSSDAWLSPYPPHPPSLRRPNPGTRIAQHSPARPPSLQPSNLGSQISQHSGLAHLTPTPSAGLSLSQTVRRQEALTRVSVNQILDKLQGSCVLCWYTGNVPTHLGVITCPFMVNTITTFWYRKMKNSLRFEDFSCCFLCLVPYDICRGTGSARLRVCSARYKDILLPLLLFLLKSRAERDRLARYIGRENIADDDSLKRWAKPKVRWNGLECSNIWLLFVSLVQDRD